MHHQMYSMLFKKIIDYEDYDADLGQLIQGIGRKKVI